MLSGNCNAALGTVSGLQADGVGIIWLDAHGDFNTPETTESGMLDGMGLATLAGLCWKNLAASIPGFRPIRGNHIVHLGGRDVSPQELRNMQTAGVQIASTEDGGGRRESDTAAALQELRNRTENVYVHLDLDVIAQSELCANEFSPPGGLRVDRLEALLCKITALFNVKAVGIASYDPAQDPEGCAAHAAKRLVAPFFEHLDPVTSA